MCVGARAVLPQPSWVLQLLLTKPPFFPGAVARRSPRPRRYAPFQNKRPSPALRAAALKAPGSLGVLRHPPPPPEGGQMRPKGRCGRAGLPARRCRFKGVGAAHRSSDASLIFCGRHPTRLEGSLQAVVMMDRNLGEGRGACSL